MTLGQAAGDQFPCRQDQHRQNVCDILYRTAIGDQKIINCMKSDGCPEQTAGSGDLQPGALPYIRQSTADDGTTDHVHGTRSNAPEKDKGKMSGSVLNQIADIFKGGKGKCNDDGGIFYRHRFRLKYKKIKEQRQEFHHFLYHRCDLRSGGNRICCVKSGKEGIDVSGEQACPHSCKTAQKEFGLPPTHAQGGDQQG